MVAGTDVRTNEENGVPDVTKSATRIKTDSPVQNWSYISLSEEAVVIKLIRTRSSVDVFYTAQRYATPNPLDSDGVVGFSEDILTAYIDLDSLINTCDLTCDEINLVTNLMDGITVRDLVEDGNPYICSADVFTALDGAARKIVAKNNEKWEISMELAHKRNCKKVITEMKWKNRGV